MNESNVFEICVEGILPDQWSDWFEGLTICNDSDGQTTLRGLLADQAALLSVLIKFQALNLSVISVNREAPGK
jgi:hypothetical protein